MTFGAVAALTQLGKASKKKQTNELEKNKNCQYEFLGWIKNFYSCWHLVYLLASKNPDIS